MEGLKMHLFGHMELAQGDRSLPGLPTRKSKELLSFVTVHWQRFHMREVLASSLWGERSDASAKKCLRNEIWRIRKVVEPTGVDPLIVRADSLGFNTAEPVWVDVLEFERRLAPYEDMGTIIQLDAKASREVRAAVELYRGDLLEGYYSDWCCAERERLRDLYLSALEKLMVFHQGHRECRAAIHYGKQILAEDPLMEGVHRELMRCYWELGNRAKALRQYSHCLQVLRRELDVGPMPETVDLHREIKAS